MTVPPPPDGPTWHYRDERRIADPGTGGLAVTAGVLLMIASVLPWLSYPAFGGGASVNGLETDGQETIVCGLVVLVLGILVRAGRARLWAPITGIVFAAIAVFSVGYRVVVQIQQHGEGSEVSPAVGLVVAVPLSLLSLYATIGSTRRMGPADDFDR